MSKISTGTIVRTIVLIVALLNQILTAAGKNPLPYSEDELYAAISLVLTSATSIFAWWKNNSFSHSAQVGDEVMRAIEREVIPADEVLYLLDSNSREGGV